MMHEEELIKYYSMIRNKVILYALVAVGNDLTIIPTTVESVTYSDGHDGLIPASVNMKLSIERAYTVSKVYEHEVDAVETLKDTASRVGIGGIGIQTLELYSYKYPELWL